MHELHSVEKVTKQMVMYLQEQNRYLYNILRNQQLILYQKISDSTAALWLRIPKKWPKPPKIFCFKMFLKYDNNVLWSMAVKDCNPLLPPNICFRSQKVLKVTLFVLKLSFLNFLLNKILPQAEFNPLSILKEQLKAQMETFPDISTCYSNGK